MLAIATNQPAPAKGQFSADAVRRTNDALVEKLAKEGVAIAAVEVCMHHPSGGAGGDLSLVGSLRVPQAQAGHASRRSSTSSAPTARPPG